jgi:hypothetical protein
MNVKKLYIDIGSGGEDFPNDQPEILCSGSVGTVQTRAYHVTQLNLTTPSPDRYFGFLTPVGVFTGPLDRRRKRTIMGTFTQKKGDGASGGAFNTTVDFIAATGNATTAIAIDPLTTRNFRVRLRANRIALARLTVKGLLFVAARHELEV